MRVRLASRGHGCENPRHSRVPSRIRRRPRTFEPLGRQVFPKGFPLIFGSGKVFSGQRMRRVMTIARSEHRMVSIRPSEGCQTQGSRDLRQSRFHQGLRGGLRGGEKDSGSGFRSGALKAECLHAFEIREPFQRRLSRFPLPIGLGEIIRACRLGRDPRRSHFARRNRSFGFGYGHHPSRMKR